MHSNSHASAYTFAVGALLYATAAATPAKAEYEVPVMRLSGEWQTSLGRMQIELNSFEGAAFGRILDPATGAPRYILWRYPGDKPEAEGGARFYWISANGKCRPWKPDCVDGRVNLKLDRTGRSLQATTIAGRPIEGSERWSGSRLRNSTEAERRLADWLGHWTSTNGPVTFRVEGEILVGEFAVPMAGGAEQRGVVTVFPGGWGAWELPNASSLQRGRADLRLAPDKRSFSGTLQFSREDDPGASSRTIALAGSRTAAADGAQPPHPSPAGPMEQPAPGTTPSMPAPVVPAAFKPLNSVDVRLDRVMVARGYSTHQVHAFLTVRNTSPGPQYFTSGFLKAMLTDADGVSLERSQPYRASGEPAELFGATPVIQPGGELKVRYIYTPPEDAQLTSLTLSEGSKTAAFPVTGL